MSILSPVSGELFTIRVYKHLDIAVDQMWANTYELRAGAGAGYADLVAAAQSLVTMEQGISHDTVTFDRVVVSTLIADGTPYDPESFISIPLTQKGLISSPITAEVLPLQVALFVRRDVASGRYGKLFYRQTVGEDDVSGRYGSFVLTSPASLISRLETAVGAGAVDELFSGGEAPLTLVMVGGVPDFFVREVTGLTVVDARLIKFNNRYFDRV